MNNIHYLLLKIPDACCRATVTKLNAGRLMDTVKLFERVGANNCAFAVNEEEEWDDDTFEKVKKDFMEICLYVYQKLMRKEKVIKINPLIEFYHQLEKGKLSPSFDNTWRRCGMGTTSIGVAFDGSLHPCQEQNSINEYKIGNVFDGIDFKLRDEYIQKYFDDMTKLKCNGFCTPALKYMCMNSQCPNKIIHNDGVISDTRCCYMRAIFYSIVRLHKLCRASIYPHIREYFGEEDPA